MNRINWNSCFYLSLLLIVAIGWSCSEDQPVGTTEVGENETRVCFTLSEGSMAMVRSGDADQVIDRLNVLVMEEQADGEYIYVLNTVASATDSDAFEIIVTANENRVKLFCIANVSDYPEVTVGSNEAAVKAQLLMDFTGEIPEYLPMFGELELEALPGGETLQNLEVTLLRSVAGVVVILQENNTELASKFRLASLQAYRANSLIRVIPDPDHYETDANGIKVTAPTIPAGAEEQQVTTTLISAGDMLVSQLSGLYIPEARSFDTEAEQRTQATCLIVGGYYGDATKATYYRVDFDTDINKVGEVLRNHLYEITIIDVTGPGTTHPEEAGDGVELSMTASVTAWEIDENTQIRYGEGGGKYFGLSSREVTLSHFEGANKTIAVETNYADYTIYWPEDPSETEVTSGGTLETTWFTIEHQGDLLFFTAKADNATGTSRVETIRVKAGEHTQTLPVKITQTSYNHYENEYATVFSFIGQLGSVGDDVVTSYADSDSTSTVLRKFFQNRAYFGPGGVVPFGGFSLVATPWESGFTPPKLAMAELIILPVTKNEQTEASDVIGWLQEKNTRVIMVYNQREDALADFGRTRKRATGIQTSDRYKVNPELADYIRNGPFGDVTVKLETDGLTMPIEDPTNIYVLDKDEPGIDPVVILDNGDIVIGIDRENRIIFLGEPYFFGAASNEHTGAFFSTDGYIRDMDGESTADIILCNVIAWVAQVIMGEQLVLYDAVE